MAQDNLVVAAIRHFGSEAKLAAAVGYTQVAINKAKHSVETGGRISAELAVAIDRATDGKFSREQFRPDLFTTMPGAAA